MNERTTPPAPVRIYRAGAGAQLRESLLALYAQRELLLTWTMREVRVRYKQAALGILWAVLQPLALMLIFTLIFTTFLRVPTNGIPYPLFSYVALLPWTLFTTAITSGTTSIINQMGLVSKIQFAREILPLASVGASLFDYAVGSLLFVGLLIYYQWPLSWTFLFVPLLLLIQLTLLAGIVLLIAAITVRFRDLRFVVPLVLQLWLYATPIIYPLDSVPAPWQNVLRLNPMTALIEGYRRALLAQQSPPLADVLYVLAVAVCLLGIGYLYFKRTEVWFADIV